MHAKLAQALNLLDIGELSILNNEGKVIRKVSPKEHAVALFSYLDLAGYLSPDLLEKAITYLSSAKPFLSPNDKIMSHLKIVFDTSHQDGTFNIEWFFDNFCNLLDVQVDDIIDLIVFLQQTAFDRQFGVERDKLQAKPWLEQYSKEFIRLSTDLGIVTPHPPTQEAYCGTGIMGASSVRVATRIQYFNSLPAKNCGEVWALSGNRELSKGLDEESIMVDIAHALDRPVSFIDKGVGPAKRSFLDGVTETMMVNFLLQKMCPGKKIALIDSGVEQNHWRATTAQGAKDIAQILVQRIQEGSIPKEKDGTYHFMIIAEQPYAGRMARQVQRAFNAEIKRKNLDAFKVIVEGVGAGIQEAELATSGVLTRMNSELGSLMAERFYDARLQLQGNINLKFRDPKIIMFMDRDAKYLELKSQNEAQLGPQPK